jgi:hypothetical protein
MCRVSTPGALAGWGLLHGSAVRGRTGLPAACMRSNASSFLPWGMPFAAWDMHAHVHCSMQHVVGAMPVCWPSVVLHATYTLSSNEHALLHSRAPSGLRQWHDPSGCAVYADGKDCCCVNFILLSPQASTGPILAPMPLMHAAWCFKPRL